MYRLRRTIVRCVLAARILRGTRSASASKISRYLEISYDEALVALRLFTVLRIVGSPNDVGFRVLDNGMRSRTLLFAIALGQRTERRGFAFYKSNAVSADPDKP
jgi:hypothetical protein